MLAPNPLAPNGRLHAAGIEVLLDVAYNHTAEGDDRDPYVISLRGLENRTYYMMNGRDVSAAVAACCGWMVDSRGGRAAAAACCGWTVKSRGRACCCCGLLWSDGEEQGAGVLLLRPAVGGR